MSIFSATHNQALKAEFQKLRHSGMIWLCLGAALFVPALTTVVGFFIDWDTPGDDRWQRIIDNNLQAFTGFFFPLFVVIMVVRLVYLEHRSDTWKLIETQPVSRAAIYLAKWEIAVLISLSCLLGLLLFSLLGGYALQIGRPSLKLNESEIDWAKTLKVITRYWVVSLGIISVQYFLSLLIKSFAWPMSIGLIAIIGGSICAGFGFFNWWPYSGSVFTSQSYAGSISGQFLMAHEKISLLWAALFLWLGFQLYRRKTFANAFYKPIKNLVLPIAAIAIFVLLLWTVNKPTQLSRYVATVIAGELDTKNPVKQVVLFRQPLMDTLLSIPVINNRFHVRTSEALPAGMYFLSAGNNRTEIFIGEKDSVYLEWKISERSTDVKVSGTRLAENAFLKSFDNGGFSDLVAYVYNQTPDDFARSVMREWRSRTKSIDDFKTVDRIKPAEDFLKLQKKLLAMKLLSIVDVEYPKVHAAYYPNEELKYPASLNKLRPAAGMNAPELASFVGYRNFVRGTARQKAGVNDSLFFAIILDSVKDEHARDMILFEGANESIFKIRDSSRRNQSIERVTSIIHNEIAKAKLIEANARTNNLQRGKPAFDIVAESLNGKEMTLSALRGKYVVIDFWATWCVPCKKETPYFEEYAQRFTTGDVAFVSVSVDDDKRAWRFEANYKRTKRVLQLLAKDARGEMSEAFALNTIPRFVLIDPNGKLVSSQLPYPSDPEFESVLMKEIPSLSRL